MWNIAMTIMEFRQILADDWGIPEGSPQGLAQGLP